MDTATKAGERAIPWNNGKLLGQKPPLNLKEIWAIRIRLQLDHRTRDLALFNLAVDSKLRGCDLVALRVHNIVKGIRMTSRAIVMQKKTQRPVQFEITEQTRDTVAAWIAAAHPKTGAIFVSEPRVSVTSSFDSAVFADCWVVGQFDRFGRSGMRHAFDATYESYDDLSADQKSQSCSVAARAHETRKHS